VGASPVNQLRLDFEALEVQPAPACAFGKLSDWCGGYHCDGCRAEGERLRASFAADVAAGVYNALGYTAREWKATGYPPAAWASAERIRGAV
jgi:hypothetical protein